MDVPERWWWLSAGNRPVQVERISEKTIALRPEAGFLQRPWSQIFRRPETDPMPQGHRVRLSGMEALVIQSDSKGRPQEVHFTFDVPLEDPSLKWLAWSEGTYVPFTPPPLGTTITVEGLDPMNLLRLALGMEKAPSIPNMVAKKSEAPAL